MNNRWSYYWEIHRSGLFDASYYLANYADVRTADVDPLLHFIEHGWEEGRSPSAAFDTVFYLETNPDVRQIGVNPLIHYLRNGRGEGRKPRPSFSTSICKSKIEREQLTAFVAEGSLDDPQRAAARKELAFIDAVEALIRH